MNFGSHIKKLRTDRKISAEKLAAIIGVDADRLRKWEQKDLNPRAEDQKIIEAAFNMRMDQIMQLTVLPEFEKVLSLKKVSKGTEELLIQQIAISKTVLHATSRLMAKVYNRDVSDCLEELEQNTKINLRDISF